MTLRAGLERTSGPAYGAWVSSRQLGGRRAEAPVVAAPGSRMLYSTGSVHVLGAALARASGQSLLAQARGRLGEPLGIEIPAWTRDPQGFYLGGNEMALSPLAMVRFGEMYRQGGRLGRRAGAQRRLGRKLLRCPDALALFGARLRLRLVPRAGAAGTGFALARGFGGQLICVVPDLALTVVITSDPTQPARSEGYFRRSDGSDRHRDDPGGGGDLSREGRTRLGVWTGDHGFRSRPGTSRFLRMSALRNGAKSHPLRARGRARPAAAGVPCRHFVRAVRASVSLLVMRLLAHHDCSPG